MKKFAAVVLGSLSESYHNSLTSLNARHANDLDWKNVKGLLIKEYMKRKEKNEKEESADIALFANRGRNFNRGRHQASGGSRGVSGGHFLNFNSLKVLSLATKNKKNTKESLALNVIRMDTL